MIHKLSHEPWYIWFKENFKWKQFFFYSSNTNCLAAVNYSSSAACGLWSLLSLRSSGCHPRGMFALTKGIYNLTCEPAMLGPQKERIWIIPSGPSNVCSCPPSFVIHGNRTVSSVLALGCLWGKTRELLSMFDLHQLGGLKGKLS